MLIYFKAPFTNGVKKVQIYPELQLDISDNQVG